MEIISLVQHGGDIETNFGETTYDPLENELLNKQRLTLKF